VGPIRDAAEESSEEEEREGEEEEEEEEEEEVSAKPKSPIVRAFKKLTSPLKSLGKRKTTELSPKSQQEREAESSRRARGRSSPSVQSIEAPEPARSGSSFYSVAMPPPSTISSSHQTVYDPFYVRRLENDLRESKEDLNIVSRRLRESQEDIGVLLRRQGSRESLMLEEIAALKARLGEGSSGRGGRAGSSSGRR
jgi:hypothetical protein